MHIPDNPVIAVLERRIDGKTFGADMLGLALPVDDRERGRAAVHSAAVSKESSRGELDQINWDAAVRTIAAISAKAAKRRGKARGAGAADTSGS